MKKPEPWKYYRRLQGVPCAAPGFKSYRYRGRYGFVMIGATDDNDALNEAARSVDHDVSFDRLEYWNGAEYKPV
jgi:hypothetical protein